MTEKTGASSSSSSSSLNAKGDVFYSLLVYNVSYSDVLVALPSSELSKKTKQPLPMLGRPKFNKYKMITDKILSLVRKNDNGKALTQIRYPGRNGEQVPYGFDLAGAAGDRLEFKEWDGFHLTSKNVGKEVGGSATVLSVYFPILAVVVPRWLEICNSNFEPGRQRILYLVSGSGKPWNTELKQEGNSTRDAAKLIKLFIDCFYGDQIRTELVNTGVRRNPSCQTFSSERGVFS